MIFIYGTKDSQTKPDYQKEAALQAGLNAEFILIDDAGHSLGAHPLLGPIKPKSVEVVLNSLNRILEHR